MVCLVSWMSNGSIVKARDYLTALKSEYPGVEIPFYMFREWYGTEQKIFFDCIVKSEEVLCREGHQLPQHR